MYFCKSGIIQSSRKTANFHKNSKLFSGILSLPLARIVQKHVQWQENYILYNPEQNRLKFLISLIYNEELHYLFTFNIVLSWQR